MTDIEWKQVTLEDKELLHGFYRTEQPYRCEFTFGNNFLWSPLYHYRFGIVEGMLVFRSCEKACTMSFPIGEKMAENYRRTIDALFAYEHENGRKLKFHSVSGEQYEWLQKMYPDRFGIEYIRDQADYMYESESLISLSGRKLHAKKNHINSFISAHPDYQYEKITDENRQECLEMAEEWGKQNNCDSDESKKTELTVTLKALSMMDQLDLTGGCLRCEGNVIAFSLGEPVNSECFVVHIEKAFADIRGAYPMINQQFVLHEAASYRYINREEDTGSEGLRKAKLSYNPVKLLEKGSVYEY